MVLDFLNIIVILFYLLSTTAYTAYLFAQKDGLQNAGYLLLFTGFVFHTVFIIAGFVELGHFPIHNLRETLSMAAWSTGVVFLILRYKYNLKVMGVYAAPFITCVFITSLNLPEVPPEAVDVFKSVWLVVHVVTVFIGEASLALAFGVGVLYLIQENAIKSKKRGFFYTRLPSLEQLDNTGYVCIVIGFTAFTIGLITGLVYAKLIWHRFVSWDPKEIWSGISWLVYAALLHERITVGWRGRRSAIMAIIGFVILLFTFFGVNFLMEGHHGDFTRW